MTSNDDDGKESGPLMVTNIIAIIINGITCPFTVLLNVLVIMAVKKRPRLQTNSNILLACLAASDALSGLTVQPSFILWKTFQLMAAGNSDRFQNIHTMLLAVLAMSSVLHLTFVTFERLFAIKFTMHYASVINERNTKTTVTVIWTLTFICGIILQLNFRLVLVFGTILLNVCFSFIVWAYLVLFLETRRVKKQIKTQQIRQDQVKKIVSDNKALKTTVFLLGAVIVCVLPGCVHGFLLLIVGTLRQINASLSSLTRTFLMLNSLVNPLIYCWRQKEMRKFLFGSRALVEPNVQHIP